MGTKVTADLFSVIAVLGAETFRKVDYWNAYMLALKANGHDAKSVGSGSEKVNLSPLSNQVKQAEASLKDVPVVDKARVEEIKQAMAEGKFKVNAEAVADKLIDTVKELLSTRKA